MTYKRKTPFGHDKEAHTGPRGFGVSQLTKAMEGINFPKKRDEIIKDYGDKKVVWTADGFQITVKEALQNIPDRTFYTMADLTKGFGQAMKAYRTGKPHEEVPVEQVRQGDMRPDA